MSTYKVCPSTGWYSVVKRNDTKEIEGGESKNFLHKIMQNASRLQVIRARHPFKVTKEHIQRVY